MEVTERVCRECGCTLFPHPGSDQRSRYKRSLTEGERTRKSEKRARELRKELAAVEGQIKEFKRSRE